MDLYSREALFGLIVPNLDGFVIWSTYQMWSVSSVEIHGINWALVAREGEVGFAISGKVPQFDGFIHGAWCEFGEIFGVESEG